MRKVLLALFLASLSACSLAYQTTQAQGVQVCAAKGDATNCPSYNTIQAAIDNAGDDAVVTLPSGTYLESGILIENKNVTLRGEDARTTIIRASAIPCQGETAGRVIRIISANVRMENLTIENGCVAYSGKSDSEQPARGAGIWNSGSLSLHQVIVQGNTIAFTSAVAQPKPWTPQGAGIYSVGSLEISNSAIISNVANSPGATAMGGGIYNNGLARIINSTISGNEVTGQGPIDQDFSGGGIYNAKTLIMDYTTVVSNAAKTTGGGMFSRGDATLANNLFYNNLPFGGQSECPLNDPCDVYIVGGAVDLGELRVETKVPVYNPAPGSASIDAGNCGKSQVKVDQVGNLRGRGAQCDLGAIESGAAFMPMAFTALPQPDLIVSAVSVEPASNLNAGTQATIKVTIQNVGSKATAGRFYVDLFINPRQEPPNYAGYTWADLCRTASCWDDEGIVWLAPPTIYPGESFTFSSNIDLDPYAVRASSKWDKYLPAGEVRLWAFVDSYEANRSPLGNVIEINEGNNRYEVKAFTVLPGRIPPFAASSAVQPGGADWLAPRPQP